MKYFQSKHFHLHVCIVPCVQYIVNVKKKSTYFCCNCIFINNLKKKLQLVIANNKIFYIGFGFQFNKFRNNDLVGQDYEVLHLILTIFQLDYGGQFYTLMEETGIPRKKSNRFFTQGYIYNTLPQKSYINNTMPQMKLTLQTLQMVNNDCKRKSNYHMILVTEALNYVNKC